MFIQQGKTNWKYILIVVFLAVIVGGGILAWQYWPKEEVKAPEEIVKDETADRKTYSWNEECGNFEIKYPDIWKVGDIHSDRLGCTGNLSYIPSGFLSFSQAADAGADQAVALNLFYSETSAVAETTFIALQEKIKEFPEKSFSAGILQCIKENYETFISLECATIKGEGYYFITGDTIKLNNQIYQILSTFRFLEPEEKVPEEVVDETTNWKTYRDEEYGFEIKYPLEWKLSEKELDREKYVKYEKGITFISPLGHIQSIPGAVEIEDGKLCYVHFLGGSETVCWNDTIPYKISIFVDSKLTWEEWNVCGPGVTCKKITLPNDINGIAWGSWTDIGECQMIAIPANRFFIILRSCVFDAYEDDEECREAFQQILSTFRFLE